MIIEGNSVSECWIGVLKALVDQRKKELSPLVIRINNTDERPDYADSLEADLNDFLITNGHMEIESTAGTIFPQSLLSGSHSIFDRYKSIWKYVKKEKKNRRGTYFQRMVSFGDLNGDGINQLQHIIETYNGIEGIRKPVHRRSALIATIFDPAIDHTPQPMLGFPCLQQVCFVPQGHHMSMNAVYAMQYVCSRAYGNYLGLMRLGNFMADNMGLDFTHMNCMLSVIELQNMSKGKAKKFVEKYC
ncbi:MAG: hypothetical protein ACRBB4_15760 [Neptuniibacter sp.]